MAVVTHGNSDVDSTVKLANPEHYDSSTEVVIDDSSVTTYIRISTWHSTSTPNRIYDPYLGWMVRLIDTDGKFVVDGDNKYIYVKEE